MQINELPQIDFAKVEVDDIISEMKTIVETMVGRTLQESDPIYLFIKAIGGIIIQQRLLIDVTAKQNLLAYATGDNLDHLGILVGCERIKAKSSTVTLKLTLSTELSSDHIISSGVRFTAGDGVYFQPTNDIIVKAGNKITEFKAMCTVAGHIGNAYSEGMINQIVDVQPYMESVINVSESGGGSDEESDEAYRERIREAPEQYSNAGSRGAYEYHTKQASALITDVSVTSPSPGVVKVQPLLTGGKIPNEEVLDLVRDRLNDRQIRPLTDQVIVEAPEVISYDIDVKYYINRSKATYAGSIQESVQTAVNNFINWQCEKLGRDVEPLELGYQLRKSGVKRVEMNSPTFIATKENQVAIVNNINVIFGGLEDD